MELLLQGGIRRLNSCNGPVTVAYQRGQTAERKGDYRSALKEYAIAEIELHKTQEKDDRKTPEQTQLELDTRRLIDAVYGVEGSDGRVSQWKRHQWYDYDIMPPGAINGVQEVHDGKVYRHGGQQIDTSFMSDLWCLDLKTKQWKELKTTGKSPGSRASHCGVMYSGYMYIFGGENPMRTNQSMMHRVHLATLKWELVKPKGGLKPCARMNSTITLYKDKFYLFGGRGNEQAILNDLWCFDPSRCKWKELMSKGAVRPTPRHVHGAWIASDKLYVFGGQTYRPGNSHKFMESEMTIATLQTVGLKTGEWEDIKVVGDQPWEIGEFTVLPLYRGKNEPSSVLIWGGYVESNRENMVLNPEDAKKH
jgi:hypothetical protein